MLTRKSQYGWMVLGGILCLCGGVVALKLREGNPAVAQTDPPPPPAPPAAPDDPPQAGSKAKPEVVIPPTALPTAAPAADADPKPPAPPVADPTPPPQPPQPPLGSTPPAVPPVADAPPTLPPPVSSPPSDMKPARGPEFPPAAAHLPPMWSEPTAPAGADATRLATPPPPADAIKVTSPAVVQASQVGEPPLAGMGPLQSYRVRGNGETMRDIARHTLGTGERCTEVYKLNPGFHAEDTLAAGTVVHLPSDACLPVDEVEGLKPLPAMRPTTAPAKPRAVMALTGTYPCNLDDKRTITLPRAVRDQFGDADVVLVSPGPDQCLWVTDPAHQERLAERLEHSPAREVDVRVFKRLYYAQTEKAEVGADGRVAVSDRLAQFAGLSQEVVLVGIDDHFELWDAARWKQYTQAKSAAGAGSD